MNTTDEFCGELVFGKKISKSRNKFCIAHANLANKMKNEIQKSKLNASNSNNYKVDDLLTVSQTVPINLKLNSGLVSSSNLNNSEKFSMPSCLIKNFDFGSQLHSSKVKPSMSPFINPLVLNNEDNEKNFDLNLQSPIKRTSEDLMIQQKLVKNEHIKMNNVIYPQNCNDNVKKYIRDPLILSQTNALNSYVNLDSIPNIELHETNNVDPNIYAHINYQNSTQLPEKSYQQYNMINMNQNYVPSPFLQQTNYINNIPTYFYPANIGNFIQTQNNNQPKNSKNGDKRFL